MRYMQQLDFLRRESYHAAKQTLPDHSARLNDQYLLLKSKRLSFIYSHWGLYIMSMQAARGKTTKSTLRRTDRKTEPTQAEQDIRAEKVAKIAADIVIALEMERNKGCIHAYDEESLLLKLAYEIKFGDHLGSAKLDEKARQDFISGKLDARIKSSDVQRQIDARQLMCDAVAFAIEHEMVHRIPQESDGMVALHLPTEKINPRRIIRPADLPRLARQTESPKWVVFLNTEEHPIPDRAYVPEKHGAASSDYLNVTLPDNNDYTPRTGREIHRLRLWGELVA